MNFWLVKCRMQLLDRQGWHWNSYFHNEGGTWDETETWGGRAWIHSKQSQIYIRDQVRKGDLVVCYQTEGRQICGLTRMADDGLDEPEGSGEYNQLSLAPVRHALEICPALTVARVRETGCNPEWLSKGQGTVFPISAGEFRGMVRAIKMQSPTMRRQLDSWLARIGYTSRTAGSVVEAAPKARTAKAGAGFCTDPIQNKKVEAAAVHVVTRWFESHAWRVKSVEQNRCGYDLECRKDGKRLDIEVKGVSGNQVCFLMTAGEVKQAKSNPRFRLCVVTDTLLPSRKCHKWSGRRFLEQFEVTPLQYMVRAESMG